MKYKYRNYEINLEENLDMLKQEIEELKRLSDLIDTDAHYEILAGKTQLIGKNKFDNIRSRIHHSENVISISKRFIKLLYETVVDDEVKDTDIYQLNLQKELLYAHIVAKTHDWGHTPFGHLGERVLNKCIQSTQISPENLHKILARKKEIYGEQYELLQGHTDDFTKSISFEHNEQSAKLLYDFVHQNKIDIQKIDLQRIINAILAHSTSRVKQEYIPNDVVAQIIRQADKIEEYAVNDFEEIKEFINLDIILDKDLRSYLEQPKEERVKLTLQRLLEETLEKGNINDDMTSLEYIRKMKKMHHEHVFFVDTDGKKGLLTGENEERITLMLRKIFKYYMDNPTLIPNQSSYHVYPVNQDAKGKRIAFRNSLSIKEIAPEEKVLDYLCQMNNEIVEKTYQQLVNKRLQRGVGEGIEPITLAEINAIKQNTFARQIAFRRIKEESEGVEHSREESIKSFREEVQGNKQKTRSFSKHKKRLETRA